MGLGSLFKLKRYSKKTFAKNSRIFSEKIKVICDLCFDSKNTIFKDKTKMLVELLTEIDRMQYKKWFNSAEIGAVDKRISETLDKMSVDVREGKANMFCARSDMLADAIASREYGKEHLSEEELRCQLAMQTALAALKDACQQKDAVAAEQRELLEKASKADKASSEMDILKSAYDKCQSKLDSLNKTIDMLSEEYRVHNDLWIIMKETKLTEEISACSLSVSEFEHLINQAAEKTSK